MSADMAGYTKVFSSIVHSTIWREPHHIRIVWVTMLAISDARGEVLASTPGLADLSRVTIDECKEALELFQSPDPDSGNPANEGRRIERIQGGWRLLNHKHYRDLMSADERRARDAERKRAERGQSGNVRARPNLSETVRDVSHTDPDPDPNTNSEPEEEISSSPAPPSVDSIAAVRLVFGEWQREHGHPQSKLDAKRTALIRRALKVHTPEQLGQAIRGALKDDWLMGRDPKSPRKYDGIETLLRDTAQIERLIDLETGKTKPNATIGRRSKIHQPDHGKTGWE